MPALGSGLRWRERGSGPATALLVHGYPLSSAIWQAQLDAVPVGWRFVAPDLPGFGDSPPAIRPHLTLDDFAEALTALLEELGARRVVVCGQSMGGYTAFRLWARHPGLVAGLVLAHTKAAPDTPEARSARYETAERVRREGVAPIVEAMLPALLSADTRTARQDVVEALRGIMLRSTVAGVEAALGAMAERPDSAPLLPGIRVPALVVAGAEDQMAPPALMRAMAEAMPNARFHAIRGAAHLSCMEAPAEFNAALTDFLASVRLT